MVADQDKGAKMTCTEDIGKFTAKIKHQGGIGYRQREVEFDIIWVSCGVYQMEYWRPRDAVNHEILGTDKEWYPPSICMCFTPEQFEKVAELYPSAPKQKRDECYKPFYENYDLSRGMFDFGDDTLFQAFKDPSEDVERVYMVNRHFVYGQPSTQTSMLSLYWDDFKRLKELLDNNKDKIFYSGCQISMPSKLVTEDQP